MFWFGVACVSVAFGAALGFAWAMWDMARVWRKQAYAFKALAEDGVKVLEEQRRTFDAVQAALREGCPICGWSLEQPAMVQP